MEDSEIEQKSEMICRQTNYTKVQALNKLNEFNGDITNVIRDYMGIIPLQKKEISKQSLNQEIYKQFREQLHITKNIENLGS